MDVATLALRVDSSGVVEGVVSLDKLSRASEKTEQSTNRLGSAFSSLKGAIAALGIGYIAKEFMDTADRAAMMDARLKLAAGSLEDFNKARQNMIALSNANRSDLEANITLYTKLADPVRNLGGGVQETTGMVDAFSKALRISGASTAEASAATLQFGQAMASGKLQGDEFKSLAETSPRFLKAMADGMNLPVGKLKEMATEGKLTADVIGNALLGQLGKLSEEASKLPTTASQAIQSLKNDVLLAVGEINEAGNFTGGFVSVIDTIREVIPGIREELSEAAATVSEWFERNKEQISDVWETAKSLGADLWEVAKTVGDIVGFVAEWVLQTGIVKTAVESIRLLVAGLQDGVTFVGGAFAKLGALILNYVVSPFGSFLEKIGTAASAMGIDLGGAIASVGKSMQGLGTAADEYAGKVYNAFANGETQVAKLSKELGTAKTVVSETGAVADLTTASMRKLASAVGSEDDSKAAAAAAKKAAAEFKKFKHDLESVIHQLDPAQKAIDDYTKQSGLLVKALEKGMITYDRYAKLMDVAAESFSHLKDNAKKYGEAEQALIDPVSERIEQVKKQMESYGKTEAQLAKLTVAELENARAIAAANGAMPEHLAFYDRLIEKQRELGTVLQQKEHLEFQMSLWGSIEKTAHDTFVSIMDGGKDTFTRLKDTIKNTFFEWLYQMTVKQWIVNISANMGGSIGSTGGSMLSSLFGGGGDSMSLGSLLNSGSTLETIYSGLANGVSASIGSYVSGAGNLVGSSSMAAYGTGMQIGSGSAANAAAAYIEAANAASQAGNTALALEYTNVANNLVQGSNVLSTSGSAAGSISGMGAAGGMVGGALLGYQLTDGNPLGTFAGGAGGVALYGAATSALAGGSALAGAGAALAAIPVWGWVALAIAAIAGGMATGGTPHIGSGVLTTTGGDGNIASQDIITQAMAKADPTLGMFSWGGYWDDGGGANAPATPALQKLAGGFASDVSSRAKKYGGNASKMTTAFGFTSDNDDWSRGTIMLYDAQGNRYFDYSKKYDSNAQKGFEQFTKDAPIRAEVAALQKIDLSDPLDKLFKMVDPLNDNIERLSTVLNLADQYSTVLEAYSNVFGELGDPFKVLAQQQADASLTLTDAWQNQYDGMSRFIEAMDYSEMSLTTLSSMTQEYYATELKLAAQLMQARQQIGDLTGNNIESLRTSVMTNEEKYNYLDKKAAADMEKLGTLNDPAAISAMVSKLNEEIMTSFQLLSEEDRKAMVEEFVGRLEDVDAKATEQLDKAQEKVQADREALGEAIKSALTEGLDAAAQKALAAATVQQQAANTMLDAANTINNSGSELAGSWSSPG